MKHQFDRLPDSELDIMMVLWNETEPVKTSAILEKLEKPWTMSTLQALLSRLEDRGFVHIKKQMRFKYYIPAISEEEYRNKETKSFLKRFYHDSVKSLFAGLADADYIKEEDIAELEEIVRKAGRNGTDI